MTLSGYEARALAQLERQTAASSRRLARRLAHRRQGRLRRLMERTAVVVGVALVAMGIVAVFLFPGVSSAVGTGFALIAAGSGCIALPRIVNVLGASSRRSANRPRS